MNGITINKAAILVADLMKTPYFDNLRVNKYGNSISIDVSYYIEDKKEEEALGDED